MDVNLLDLLKQALGGNFGRLVSQFLGEPEGATQSTLDALLPAVLGGVVRKGATEGAPSLFSLLTGPNVDASLLDNVAGLFSGDGAGADSLVSKGVGLVKSLFGDKSDALGNALASVGGIKDISASKLLGLGVPLVLGFLRRFIGEKGLNASSFASLLTDHCKYLENVLDRRLTNALGFASPSAYLRCEAAEPAAVKRAAAYAPEPVRAKVTWWPWLLIPLAILAGLLLWRLLSQPTGEPKYAAVPAPSKGVVVECGFPAKIYFEVGRAEIGPEGMKVIKEAAACIKREGLKVNITGYTDKTGDVDKNLELAKNRAKAVSDALIAEGLAEWIVTLKPPLFHIITGTTGTGADAEARRVEINKAFLVK